MILVSIIDILVFFALVWICAIKGLEAALPFFCFVLTFFPLESHLYLPGLFDLTTGRLAILVLACLYLVFGNQNREAVALDTTPLKYLIVLHMLWCLLSTFNSIVPSMSLKKLASLILEHYFVYYLLVKNITSVRTIYKILAAMVGAVGLACFFGAFEIYSSWSIMSWFPETAYRFRLGDIDIERGFRVRSTFPHAIHFGEAIAIAVPLALFLLTIAKTTTQKVLLWLGLMLMFLNIYKTSSRGPWISLMVSFALLLLFSHAKVRRYLLSIAALTLLVLIIRPGVWETIHDDYTATVDPHSVMGGSWDYRAALLQVSEVALAQDSSRMMWGYGLESFFSLGLKGEFQGKANHKFESCDSTFVELMVETGYVGMLLWVAIFIKAGYLTFKNIFRVAPPNNTLSTVFLVIMIGYCLLMTSAEIYSWGQTGSMIWIIIACSLTLGGLKRPERLLDPSEVLVPVRTIEDAWRPVSALDLNLSSV